jgi:hypothetical protein
LFLTREVPFCGFKCGVEFSITSMGDGRLLFEHVIHADELSFYIRRLQRYGRIRADRTSGTGHSEAKDALLPVNGVA